MAQMMYEANVPQRSKGRRFAEAQGAPKFKNTDMRIMPNYGSAGTPVRARDRLGNVSK